MRAETLGNELVRRLATDRSMSREAAVVTMDATANASAAATNAPTNA
jgi:hypothetical protein